MKIPLLTAALLVTSAAHAQQPAEVRVWGFDGIEPLLLRWEAAYTHAHPEVHFTNTLHGAASAMAGLYNGVADIVVMGREVWPVDTMAYHWVYQRQPFGVAVVTGGTDAPAQSFSPVVIVNRSNPLTSITPAQLDAIYGSEHRAAPANARTWGDLGLTGAWASKPIRPVGYGPEDALGVYFRHDILKADFKPNPDARLLSDRDPGAKTAAARRIDSDVASDPTAIGYTSGRALPAGVKIIPVAGVAPTQEAVEDHQYPLSRALSFFVNRTYDKPLPAPVDGFLRFILTAQGQAEVRPAEGFLPLTATLAGQEVERLNKPMPPERKAAVAEDAP